MTGTIVDINLVRLTGLLGHQVINPIRTKVVRKQCCVCEGHGLLRVSNGKIVPVSQHEAMMRQYPVYICRHCLGVGSTVEEVEVQGEVA